MKATVSFLWNWSQNKSSRTVVLSLIVALCAAELRADGKASKLPLKEDWSDIGRIAKDNDWSAVPGFVGYRGDKLATRPGVSPQEIVTDGTSTPVSVIS